MDSSLMIRLKGIEEKYDLDKEVKTNLNYARYLLNKKYFELSQYQKEEIGVYLGICEKVCKAINTARVETIKLRVVLSNEMPHGNKK